MTDQISCPCALFAEAQAQPIFGLEMRRLGHACRARSVCGPPLGGSFGLRGHIWMPVVRMRHTVGDGLSGHLPMLLCSSGDTVLATDKTTTTKGNVKNH
jgi:hypothetical protein